MISLQVNFVQTDRWTKVKLYAPDLLTLSQTSPDFYVSAIQVF